MEKLNERQEELLKFVTSKHGSQKRLCGSPYIEHLLDVVETVERFDNSWYLYQEVCLCHDILEDTNCDHWGLREKLVLIGYTVGESNFVVSRVLELTDIYTKEKYPEINRADRKKLECERLSEISRYSQTMKYADIISNIKDIKNIEEKFSKVYILEKREIMKHMHSLIKNGL